MKRLKVWKKKKNYDNTFYGISGVIVLPTLASAIIFTKKHEYFLLSPQSKIYISNVSCIVTNPYLSCRLANVVPEMAKPVPAALPPRIGRVGEQPDERDNEIVIEVGRENQYSRTQPRANEPQGNNDTKTKKNSLQQQRQHCRSTCNTNPQSPVFIDLLYNFIYWFILQ